MLEVVPTPALRSEHGNRQYSKPDLPSRAGKLGEPTAPLQPGQTHQGRQPPNPRSSCTGWQQALTAKARVCSKSRVSASLSRELLKQHWPPGEGSPKACGQHGEQWRPLFTYNRRVFQLYLQHKYDCNYLPLTMHLEDNNSSKVLLSSGNLLSSTNILFSFRPTASELSMRAVSSWLSGSSGIFLLNPSLVARATENDSREGLGGPKGRCALPFTAPTPRETTQRWVGGKPPRDVL